MDLHFFPHVRGSFVNHDGITLIRVSNKTSRGYTEAAVYILFMDALMICAYQLEGHWALLDTKSSVGASSKASLSAT